MIEIQLNMINNEADLNGQTSLAQLSLKYQRKDI